MLDLKPPIFLTNFKTYLEGTGDNACRLAQIAKSASENTGIQVIIAPQICDILQVSSTTDLPVFSQHVDAVEPGRHTGYTLIEAVKQAGAQGAIINHSEHQMTLAEIQYVIDRCQKVGLISCVCTDTPETSASVAHLRPDAVLFEPPELIGSGNSVSKTRPMSITETKKLVRSVNSDVILMCGAGITSGKDVETAIQLGMQGVGSTTGFVKASDPHLAITDMISVLKRFIVE